VREQQKSLMGIRILKEEEELLAAKEKRVNQKIEHENNVKEHRKKTEILQSFAALKVLIFICLNLMISIFITLNTIHFQLRFF